MLKRTPFLNETGDLIMTTTIAGRSQDDHRLSRSNGDTLKEEESGNIFYHLKHIAAEEVDEEYNYSAYEGLESISVCQPNNSTENTRMKPNHDASNLKCDSKKDLVAPHWLLDASPSIKFIIFSSATLLFVSLAVLICGLSIEPKGQAFGFESTSSTDVSNDGLSQEELYYNTKTSHQDTISPSSHLTSDAPSASPSKKLELFSDIPTISNSHGLPFPTDEVPSFTEFNRSFPPHLGMKEEEEELLQDSITSNPSEELVEEQNTKTPNETFDGEFNTVKELGDEEETEYNYLETSNPPSELGIINIPKPMLHAQPSTQPSTKRKHIETTPPYKNKNDVVPSKNNQEHSSRPTLQKLPIYPPQSLPPTPSPAPTLVPKEPHVTKFYTISRNRPKDESVAPLLSSLPKDADFLIHLGNWNTRKKSRCSPNAYEQMRTAYRHSSVPVLFVVSNCFLFINLVIQSHADRYHYPLAWKS